MRRIIIYNAENKNCPIHIIFINGRLTILKNLRSLQLKKKLIDQKDRVKMSHRVYLIVFESYSHLSTQVLPEIKKCCGINISF